MASKPSIIILGGCGFVGRHLVEFLVKNNLTDELRIVDKTPPQMAWLNEAHKEIFKNPTVEFKSANLIFPGSCKTAFALPSSGKWDYVINCAAETRLSQSEPVYEQGIYQLSINCAKEAAALSVQRYIELSSGNMNSNDKTAHKEGDSENPWTLIAKYKLKVEKELRKMDNLKFSILRLPIVYGISDKKGLTPRIIIAALYRTMNETMKLLWDASMKLNTVHVTDVVESLWLLINNQQAIKETYNIVDDSDSTQGSISEILADLFNIKIEYVGVMKSSFTKLNMSSVIEDINNIHMAPWAEICQVDQINNTPLTPYMDEELLYHKHLYLDNSKLKKLGFQFKIPNLTADKVKEIIFDFVREGLFPESMTLSM